MIVVFVYVGAIRMNNGMVIQLLKPNHLNQFRYDTLPLCHFFQGLVSDSLNSLKDFLVVPCDRFDGSVIYN